MLPGVPLTTPHRLLVDAIAPPACPACGESVGVAGALCPACRRALPWLGAPLCPRCALPEPCSGTARHACPAASRAWDRAWAPFAHEGPARALVAGLKFRGLLAAADVLAAPIAAGAPALLEDAALVPVPADPGRRRARGLDHAALLAGALARRTGRPVAPCLRRRRAPRQLGAGRSARLAAGGRWAPWAAGPVPRRAVLVDDVHTTGATLDGCARALREAGAESVHAVTATRTLG